MINQQQQLVFNLLIEDSKRIFQIINDRHLLYNALSRSINIPEIAEIILKHESLNNQENLIVQKYKGKHIKTITKLKSFFIRFHCRLDEIISKSNVDPQIIKFTAFDNLQILKQDDIIAQNVVRSLFLHPKIQIERLLQRNLRNRSLKQIRKAKTDCKMSKDSSFYSVLPENKQLYAEWSRSSQKLYESLDIEAKDIYCFTRPKKFNKECLLHEIIQRNRSIRHCIKDYKKNYNIQNKIVQMRKVKKTKQIQRSKTLKISDQYPMQPNYRNKKSTIFRKISPKPLQVVNRTNLVY